MRYGANLLPVEYKSSSQAAPLFCYPYDRSREALEMLHRNGPLDPLHGAKLQYINPVTGSCFPAFVFAAFLQLLPQELRIKAMPTGPPMPLSIAASRVRAEARWAQKRLIGQSTTCSSHLALVARSSSS